MSVDLKTLQSLYGLTRSETEITRRLETGLSPKSIAQERGSSLATIRTQIKAIHGKTGVGNQAELAALILNSLAVAS